MSELRTQIKFEEWKTQYFPRISPSKEYDDSIPYANYLWEKTDVDFMQYSGKIWSVVRYDLPSDNGEFDRPLYTQLVAGKKHDAIHFMITTLYAKDNVFVILN
ncbi:MAG TPA: hypothetical protein PKD00_02950 [Burkholderiales bacterium]|nr:hypothetical protein [Burkholderiales bacterium]